MNLSEHPIALKNRPDAPAEPASSEDESSSRVVDESASRTEPESITIIEPRSGWRLIDFRECYRYRELLFFLVWRDVKVRYKQTVLGALWAVLQPLATMIVFTLFIGRLAGRDSTDIPYSLYAYIGLVPWTFFAAAISNAGSSIVGNQNLIAKVYFPRIFIPVGAAGAALVDFAIASILIVPLLFYFQIQPSLSVLVVIPCTLLLITAAVGVGTLLAALTVAYRDFRHVVPFMVQIWMFATPCIYLPSEVYANSKWSALLPLNPAYGCIMNFRAALTGGQMDYYALATSGTTSIAVLVIGMLYFRRVESSFADIV